MGILSKIFDRIRNHGKDQTQTAPAGTTTAQANTTTQPGTTGQPGTTPAQTQTAPVAMSEINAEAVLESLAAKSSQKLNWRTSIVDLMKLLGMESSLAERKELADELGYKGDKSDSAAMNIWLHDQVMKKFAANGGKVPANMMD